MKVAVYSTKPHDEAFLSNANSNFGHQLHFFKTRLTPETMQAATGYPCVCVFVNDVLDESVLRTLKEQGTELIALRCAGFNNVDLHAAAALGIKIVRVPAYSPYSVAEHTLALILSLSRHTHKAYNRVRDGNFSLKGLLGVELHGLTVGIIGTGNIGAIVSRILAGFGCRILAYDIKPNPKCLEEGVAYVDLPDLYSESDIVTLHCPLNKETYHLIDNEAFAQMKDGVMLINTGRGAIIDTKAAIVAIKSGKLGHLGLDVYEQEGDLFFEDLSDKIIDDDVFVRLLTFPNVIVTGHQGFFTKNALQNIAETTLRNIQDYADRKPLKNQVNPDFIIAA